MPEYEKPFAGRDTLYAYMQQQILDPGERFALLFTGHNGVGKTRLLQHFPAVFQDTLLGVQLSAQQFPFSSEADWLRILIQQTNLVLEAHQFSMSRIPQLESAGDEELFSWLRDTYLPEVLRVIRPQRRLVWLIDDAQFLLERLPASHLQDLSNLLQTHPQLAIVCTLHTRYEDQIKALAPLVNPATVERIRRLSAQESADLLRLYHADLQTSQIDTIYRMTAGHPQLVERYGIALQDGADPDAAVYLASMDDFRAQWQESSLDEKHVMTAIASLQAAAPQQAITAQRIHWWLSQGDYGLDLIAIHAVLRALDYQEIASIQADQGIRFVSGLLERWMLEHARDENQTLPVEGSSRRLLLALLVLAGLLILAVALYPTTVLPPITIEPTVTLSR
jgi:energy-coupling factor transporter ATP-binding protein EcfA2